METMMKAIRKIEEGPGTVLQQIPIPTPADDEILVKILASALCKSDLDVVHATESFRLSHVPVPFTLGHEFCGEVIKIGENVKEFQIGDHVCGETHVPCGICKTCKEGMSHICPDMGLIGRTVDGCFAEYMALPAVSAVKVDKEILPEQAALFEPFGVAVHGIQVAEVSGKTVLITGTGTIGSMALECARKLGAVKVIVTSRDDDKLEMALDLGADGVINTTRESIGKRVMEETEGAGVDCVIEMTGVSDIVNQAIDSLRPGGKLVCVGNHNKAFTMENFTGRIMYREITVTGIFGRRMFDTWNLAVELVKSGGIDLEKYVGKRMRLEDFDQAVEGFNQVFGRMVFLMDERRCINA
ncbi:MAG: alcohol dehydrogenase catalytic domain-containing protein [Firmicutes bacterium]|nr:alcohol dehydrogenase catalytic domain-containing protein [Bacillota bacterium]